MINTLGIFVLYLFFLSGAEVKEKAGEAVDAAKEAGMFNQLNVSYF